MICGHARAHCRFVCSENEKKETHARRYHGDGDAQHALLQRNRPTHLKALAGSGVEPATPPGVSASSAELLFLLNMDVKTHLCLSLYVKTFLETFLKFSLI